MHPHHDFIPDFSSKDSISRRLILFFFFFFVISLSLTTCLKTFLQISRVPRVKTIERVIVVSLAQMVYSEKHIREGHSHHEVLRSSYQTLDMT